MKKFDGVTNMHYEYELEIDGRIVDIDDPELSKIVTGMWLNLYRIYKNDPSIFPVTEAKDIKKQ